MIAQLLQFLFYKELAAVADHVFDIEFHVFGPGADAFEKMPAVFAIALNNAVSV